jgi:hypothetical protein
MPTRQDALRTIDSGTMMPFDLNPMGHVVAVAIVSYLMYVRRHGNMHGFTYQAQAIHRCIAAGLRGCPQFTETESVHVCEIIDQINAQIAEQQQAK